MYFTNCAAWCVQIVLLIGLQVIYLSVDNVLFLMVSHQTGSIFWLVSHKNRFLALFYYNNDIVKLIRYSIRLFADNTKIVSMIKKYHNHKLQTNPLHREEEPRNNQETPGRQTKQSNQLSLPHQDDCKTRMDIK